MFEFDQVKEAYIKLKSYIYYDNTDILLRRKLVEFETGKTKKENIISISETSPYIDVLKKKSEKTSSILDKKLEVFSLKLNDYHKEPDFFNHFLKLIEVSFYPKSIKQDFLDENFITNRRVRKNYDIERATAFIDAPIELHLLAVLWIMEYGKKMDVELGSYCLGNRLLMNNDNSKVVQGSGLFKPYYKQYQRWRDDSVRAAEEIFKQDKNVLFLNLDISDYFHSVRISTETFVDRTETIKQFQPHTNLKDIFLRIHTIYTDKVSSQYQIPFDFLNQLLKDENGNLEEIVLPIGLLSSYVLANNYLVNFDKSIIHKIKPSYYGRYVDDILIVIADPKFDDEGFEDVPGLEFIFDDYKKLINSKDTLGEVSVSFEEKDLTKLEKYVLLNFDPVLKLIDLPYFLSNPQKNKSSKTERIFKINNYKNLYCQSRKSLVYFFDKDESDLVIDKLKRELDKRTSEFRDFPEEGKGDDSFEESAYHLQYDGTDGKIRTLKDYKEDRYGLTVYLSNKIFGALRHETKTGEVEIDEVLKFFKGLNCLEFYRLWERVFTFFLVNQKPLAYVKFYIHCIEQIQKITGQVPNTKVKDNYIKRTLVQHLDCAHEISLSLNPEFIEKAKEASVHFSFKLNQLENPYYGSIIEGFAPTRDESYWVNRFRETNMIRHHYVVQPLLNYTKGSKAGKINLVNLIFNIDEYKLDDFLLENSPRPVKFWECCIATVFAQIANLDTSKIDRQTEYFLTNLLGINYSKDLQESDANHPFYLHEAFNIYKKANQNHIPNYKLNEGTLENEFFKRKTTPVKYDSIDPIMVQEFTINNQEKLQKPKIAFANTEVNEFNLVSALRGVPNLQITRFQKLAKILRKAREEKADLLLFPESFIPIHLLSSITRHAEQNVQLTVTGLEHLIIRNIAFNFIVTILPVTVSNIKDAVVVFRLKNHYAPNEELLIDGNHSIIPKPNPYRYDIFNWRNIYFSSYYCFEMADVLHRSLLKGKIDLLIGIEYNRDTPYFSNIVEAGSRDLHVYVAQVNTSQYGDTRLTQPVESARKDIIRLKGGINDSILVGIIDIFKLREFQRKKFSLTYPDKEFKPLPPDYRVKDVLNRINNSSVL